MFKSMAKMGIRALGYRLVKDHDPDADMEAEFRALHESCRVYSMTPAEHMYNLYLAMKYVLRAGIPGDIVECGVWRGGSCMLCASMLSAAADTARKVYLYDTFAGMVAPTELDISADGQWNTRDVWNRSQRGDHNEWCYAPLDDVKRNMSRTGFPESRTVFVKGRVEETLPVVLPERVALLRLDTDWYDSTATELSHLYPRLSAGGVLIVDDYGQWQGQRKAVDDYVSGNGLDILLTRIGPAARMGIKPPGR